MARIEDVAKRAGVSASTVSYVLSGRRSISEPTRQRVHEAIDALNYRPHAGARALASQRTHVIGLIAPLRPDVDVSVIMQFVAGVVTRSRSHGHDVLMLTNDDPDGVERVAAGLVDALIVMDVESSDWRLPAMSRMAQPCILIGVPDDTDGLSCIDFDFEQAGRLAVRHLAATGARHLALVGSPPAVLERHTSYADRMVRGVTDEASELGLGMITRSSEASFAAGSDQMAALLAEHPDLDGVVVHNEAATDGVLTALARAGRRIGDDTPVVVVGPREMVARHGVAVATIDIPGRLIGSTAVDMAMAALGSSEHPAEVRLIAPRLESDSSQP
ncbi:LacI family DNA-binding transcriptional regulator [Aestuariimicrobium sp. T2.26MG-19.2B]|uniref:LacI family DNA-binding transcriptional regulator n=1 Tax=Aestuariimicrobium sp. T2.26MG-19.2B TaxID=3040679 RepID=UPI002477A3B7|nr:LacI family DNA-binding transcriptional regulator [Aestuariimicrobium sp. T2.26MG-19.2B]CAI9405602.1 Catabolite control protein A [Aestuariimicrobium sp. T2.26MG-19.2B]